MVNPVVLVTPGLIINGIVLSWIFKIERQCECSRDWRRDVIKYVSIASVVQMLAVLGRIRIPPVVLMTVALAGLVNLYSVLTYIPKLQRECSCATEYEWRDNFIFWWVLIGLALSVAGVVFAVAVARR
jgi:hypothetical protein